MALRTPRISAQTQPAPGSSRTLAASDALPVLPQMPTSRPRDTVLQERLRKIAAAQAVEKAAAEQAPCNRRTRRKSTSLPGLITFKTMRLQVPCTIADMSGTGARLVLPATTSQTFGDLEHLPKQITLVMRADRMQVECEIKWRRTGSLGVRFLGPPVPLPKPSR